MSKTAVKLLFVYHASDQSMLDNLKDHLHFPVKNGTVELMDDYRLTDNVDKDGFSDYLKTADIVIPLFSKSLIGNFQLIKSEIAPSTNLVPIIISPCEWNEHVLKVHTILPEFRLPVSSWNLQDEALLSIVEDLLKIPEQIDHSTPNNASDSLSEMEREGLKQQQEILVEKLSYLRKNMASMADGSKKFELMKDIEQLEKEIKDIQDKIS